MLKFMVHCYQYAEAYVFLLGWIVLPLGYYSAYLFLNNHFGLFEPGHQPPKEDSAAETISATTVNEPVEETYGQA